MIKNLSVDYLGSVDAASRDEAETIGRREFGCDPGDEIDVQQDDEKPKKPQGFKAFDRLARLLVKVPKSEIPARKPKWKRKKK